MNGLFVMALGRSAVGASDSDIETLLTDFRRDDYALIRGVRGT